MADQKNQVPNAAIQDIRYGQQKGVHESMIRAGTQGKSRILAGARAAVAAKKSSLLGEDSTAVAGFLNFFGAHTSAKWIDRFFAKESAAKQLENARNKKDAGIFTDKEAKKINKRRAELQEKFVKEWKKSTKNRPLTKKAVDAIDSAINAILTKEFPKYAEAYPQKEKGEESSDGTTIVVNNDTGTGELVGIKKQITFISSTVMGIADDVNDIKSLIMPKGVVAENKAGEQQFVQFNPLAPQGEQFHVVTEKGKLLPTKPSKEHQKDAEKKAAKETAKLALKIMEKDRAKVELKKKYEYKDKEEKVKKEDPVEALREDMNENFDKVFKLFKKDSFLDKIMSGLMGILNWLKNSWLFKGGLLGLAGALGYKLGTYLWEKFGTQVLDAVFAIKAWWEKLDVLGMIRPITEGIRRITDKFGITKSDAEYKREEAANAKKGYTRGGVASTKGMSMDETIAYHDNIVKTGTPEQREASRKVRDTLISQKMQRAAGAPVTAAPVETAPVLPSTSGPTSRGGKRGRVVETIPAAIMEEGSDTVDTNYSDVPVAPSIPATSGTGAITRTQDQRLKQLGDIIASGESKGDYNIFNKGTVGKNAGKIGREDLSKMTIAEYLDRSKLGKDDPQKMFAVGKYQIIPDTMRDAVQKLGLNPTTTTLNPQTQEMIFKEYLTKTRRPKIHAYITGKSDDLDAAVMEMAKEWASVGVPHDTMRGDTLIKKGQSYYSGVGGNKAHTSPESIAAAITPAAPIPGARMDGESRVLQASNSPASVTVVGAPTVVNNTNVSQTVGKRPVAKADVLAQDKSLVRTISKDTVHPVYG